MSRRSDFRSAWRNGIERLAEPHDAATCRAHQLQHRAREGGFAWSPDSPTMPTASPGLDDELYVGYDGLQLCGLS